MRADRLLSILMLLQVHGRLTAHELAERLEVSERTIHRDMEALSSAGVPVTAERGQSGGWSLLDNYQTTLTGLNLAEIQALFLPKPTHLLADLGWGQAFEAALLKLLAALPTANRQQAEVVSQRIHLDPAGWQRWEEEMSAFPVLQAAVWQERQLELSYERSDGKLVERIVNPLGLVAKGSVWYFIAAVDEEVRSYRISRVRNARVMESPCIRPDGFNLAEYWQRSLVEFKANLPRYEVLLRVAPDALPRLRYAGYFAKIEHIGSPDAEGWIPASIRFDIEEAACAYVLGFGGQMEVLEPLELRDRILQTAKEAIALYTKG
ncbi:MULTISPECIES: YafY family protein [unclassified Leptolyngbya]|uniref:helix-turn-helix transcriptional regulator n=1 Tax=unclassified Leptolyngbya TaxID=2650499 RepID=UPI001688925B|nr:MULTISPECIES: YafY family protein [unclassified Leptolyngbya]MBD1909808.1 YafY family transcriptional regulator [Leptolyngbya sp. FACHB-8]MBD2158959.1 YafY family transcriptional regulator [Leptolyngbya sp. FACHB-16]